MDIQEIWEKALKNTQIVRPRIQALLTDGTTNLSYLFLSESTVNSGDTVVRRGEVFVEKPGIVLPEYFAQFEGFDFEKEFQIGKDMLTNFLLVRGVRFPPLKYDNKTSSLDMYEGQIKKAINYFSDILQREEDVHTGLITGPDDCWQFSILIFICCQIMQSADSDVKKLLEEFRKRGRLF